MTCRDDYYEQKGLFGQGPAPYQKQVLADILNLLPDDVESVLDVGCGDGYITNSLPERLHVVGLDISEEAIRHVKRQTKIGSVTEIPFADNSFDLVTSNDLLEHLPDDSYRCGLKEIRRVARKYIIISVPFMENIASGLTRCAACGNLYHVNHHVRSFGFAELNSLYGSLTPRMLVFSGAETDTAEVYYRFLREKLGILNQWDKAMCPYCGAKESISSVSGKVSARIAAVARELPLLSHSLHPDRTECIAMFYLDSPPSESVSEEAPGSIRLVARVSGEIIEVPSRLNSREDGLVIESLAPDKTGTEHPVWIEWLMPQQTCRYSAPERTEAGEFLVPLWFNPQSIRQLSTDRVLGMDSTTNEGLLVAMSGLAGSLSATRRDLDTAKERLAEMEQALALRRGFRGVFLCLRDLVKAKDRGI